MATRKLPLIGAMIALVAAFSSEDAVPFAIAPTIHQKITIEALSDPHFNYLLPNGSVQVFNTTALSRIAQSNADIDIWSFKTERIAEDYHFDDERFAIGQDLLLKTRNLIILQLGDAAFGKSEPADLARQTELSLSSRELLGNALHTVQDYYSHSNWVEQQLLLPGNPKLNLDLGAKGKQLETPANAVCSDGNPGQGLHTSGDYLASGVADCLNICDARANKCAHGNVLSTIELPIVCPLNWAAVIPDCGLNKDRGFRDGHAPAYELAKQHSALFVAKIFDEALNRPGANKSQVAVAICQLMGVPDPGTTCITQHTLTVQKINQAGGGATAEGLVQSTSGNVTPAIDCGSNCQGAAVGGNEVQLTAGDTPPWIFVRWEQGGACAGSTSRTCTVTLNSNQTAKAVFVESIPLALNSTGFEYGCSLEIYQNSKYCDGLSEEFSGNGSFYVEHGADYGGTPQSGGGFAFINVSGQFTSGPGYAALEASVDASAVGQWFSRGRQDLSASYLQSVFIGSNTLAPGAPVTLRVTYAIAVNYTQDISLSEPPLVQWYVTWPSVTAYVDAHSESGNVSISNPGGSPEHFSEARNDYVDLVLHTEVGAFITFHVIIDATINTLQASRAHIQASMGAQVNGPLVSEVNGQDIYFIDP